MEKIIRFVKTCTFVHYRNINGKPVKMLFEFAMYATRKEYYATATFKGKVVRDFVEIDAYGLFAYEIFEEGDGVRKSEPIDFGIKTAHPRHVNTFIHQVCRSPIKDLQSIRALYEEESTSHAWCEGWPDAFAKAASVQLCRNLSVVKHQPISERVRLKRRGLMKKLNPFRDLPKPHDQNGRFDA